MDRLLALWEFAMAYPVLAVIFLAWGTAVAVGRASTQVDEYGSPLSRQNKTAVFLGLGYMIGLAMAFFIAMISSERDFRGDILGNQLWMMTLPILVEQGLYFARRPISWAKDRFASLRAWHARSKAEKSAERVKQEAEKQRGRSEILARFDTAIGAARTAFLEGRKIEELDEFVKRTDGWRDTLERLLERREAIDALLSEMGSPDEIDVMVREIDQIEPESSLLETAGADIAEAKKVFEKIKGKRRQIGAEIERRLLQAEMLPLDIANAKSEVVLSPPEDTSWLEELLAEPLEPVPGLNLRLAGAEASAAPQGAVRTTIKA